MIHGCHPCQARSAYQFTDPRQTQLDTPFLSSLIITDKLVTLVLDVHDVRYAIWTFADLLPQSPQMRSDRLGRVQVLCVAPMKLLHQFMVRNNLPCPRHQTRQQMKFRGSQVH